MTIQQQNDEGRRFSGTLLRSARITPTASPEEVRNLVFRTEDRSFDGRTGQCVRVLAPGKFGNKHHTRLYSLAEVEEGERDSTEFTLCVRRCHYVDDFNGQEYPGVASNFLCDLQPGSEVQFTGPTGYPFAVPDNPQADILMIGMGTGIAPFRGLVREIYRRHGGWQGRVRLFHGARSGLEMLYMNDENKDFSLYYDQATFRAFQAVSPRPHFGAPVAMDRALEQNAAEVWEMLQGADTRVFIAGPQALQATVDKAIAAMAGSADRWRALRQRLADGGRWQEVLY
ncbi:MAG: oxidoreductase [Betaproteobacteria bacterium]|nr:oxidoreductase [Betaproteobacteria bacterium]